MTVMGDPDDWARQVFTEQEVIDLRQQADDVLAEVQAENDDDVTVSIETFIDRDVVPEVVGWLRHQHSEYAACAVSDFLWACGVNLCFAYLVDNDWPYDEVMSDHATYFGARDFFGDIDDDE